MLSKELEINFPKIYGENITIEDVIINQIKPYKFQEHRIEDYKRLFYRGVEYFLMGHDYFIAKPFWEKLLYEDNFVDIYGYKNLFKEQVKGFVFQESIDFFKK